MIFLIIIFVCVCLCACTVLMHVHNNASLPHHIIIGGVYLLISYNYSPNKMDTDQ